MPLMKLYHKSVKVSILRKCELLNAAQRNHALHSILTVESTHVSVVFFNVALISPNYPHMNVSSVEIL
jgi:hypothetical protein